MYNHIEGKLKEKNPTCAVIDCNGVGYLLNISVYTYSKIPDKEHCRLLTHLIVKEDAHTLYGFADEDERRLFRMLISVSGIGAATARLIFSSLSPPEVQQAIVSANVPLLQSVKGIGGKTAQRIIIELQGKLGKSDAHGTLPAGVLQDNRIKEEALSALVTLGFTKNLAEKAVDQILRSSAEKVGVERLIKLALNNL